MKKLLFIIGLLIGTNVYAQPNTIRTGGGDIITESGDTLYKNGAFLAYFGGSGGSQNIHQVLGVGDSTFRKIVWKDTAAASTGITRWQLKPRGYGTVYPPGNQAAGKIEMFDAKYVYYPGVNASGRPNIVASWMDYNGGFGATRYNNTEAAFSFRAESHYEMQGGKWFEFHLPEMTDSAGNVRRLWSFYTRKSDGFTNLTSQINSLTIFRNRSDTPMLVVNPSALRYYSENESVQFSIGQPYGTNSYSAQTSNYGTVFGMGALLKSQSAFSFLGRVLARIDTAFGGADGDAAMNLDVATPTGRGINVTTSGRGLASTGIQSGLVATFSTSNFANAINATNNSGDIRSLISTTTGVAQYRLNNWVIRNNSTTSRNALFINPSTNSDSALAIIPTLNFIKMKYSVGIGTADPTARLHLPAGTATASTAPLKLTSGTSLTTPENGAVEYDGTNYFVTTGGVRYILTRTIIGNDVPAITPQAVGIQFVDTTNGKIYVSIGTASSADWEILN